MSVVEHWPTKDEIKEKQYRAYSRLATAEIVYIMALRKICEYTGDPYVKMIAEFAELAARYGKDPAHKNEVERMIMEVLGK